MGAVIARPPLPPGPFLVLGLARSGVAAAQALTARGHRVVASDARVVGDEVRAALLATGARCATARRARTCSTGSRP